MDGLVSVACLVGLMGICLVYLRSTAKPKPAAKEVTNQSKMRVPPRVSFLDNLSIFFSSSPHQVVSRLRQKYGPIFEVSVGDNDFVIVGDVETVMTLEHEFSAALMGTPMSTSAVLVGGSHISEGKSWRKRRVVALSSVRSIFNESSEILYRILVGETEVLFRNLNTKVVCQSSEGGLPDDAFKIDKCIQIDLTTFAARLMFRLTYGNGHDMDDRFVRDIDQIANDIQEYSRNTGPFSKLDYFPWMKWIHREGYNRCKNVMHRIKHLCATNKIERTGACGMDKPDQEGMHDLMAFFMRSAKRLRKDVNENVGLTDDIVYDGLEDFLRAGTETGASILHWMTLILAIHQQVQEQMFQEILNTLGSDTTPSLEELDSLPYTKAVYYETLRFSTLNPFFKRKVLDDVQIKDFFLPVGTTIVINNYSINQDPANWQKADDFLPERFLTPDGAFNTDKLSLFLPFGFGRRRCPGERLGIASVFFSIVSLVQRFHFILLPNADPCLDAVYGISQTPKVFPVRVRTR